MVEPPKGSLTVEPACASLSVEPACASFVIDRLMGALAHSTALSYLFERGAAIEIYLPTHPANTRA